MKAVLEYDHAKYCDLIYKYTLQNFCDFEVVAAEKDGKAVAIFVINAPDFPLIFQKPGTYAVSNNKQQSAFSQGTIFFRHGAKSEHGTTDDLRRFMQQRIREMRDELTRGLRKVSEAPRGSQIQVVPSMSASEINANAVRFRLTNDPEAQGVVAVDRGKLCPYRQKEVIAKLRERLPDGPIPTSHDIRAINKIYKVPSKEEFCWEPEFSSKQYSDAFIDWIVGKIQTEKNFLQNIRDALYEMEHP